MRRLLLAGLIACAGCGNGAKKAAQPPKVAAAAEPEPPPPSCSIAINEFLWAVEVHDSQRMRDELVSECVDNGWTGEQRRCVAAATDEDGVRRCSIKSRVALVPGSRDPNAELGIAECDQMLARYRRCILPGKAPPSKQDTAEALVETIAIWREGLARPGSAQKLQAQCQRIARSLQRLFDSEGCGED